MTWLKELVTWQSLDLCFPKPEPIKETTGSIIQGELSGSRTLKLKSKKIFLCDYKKISQAQTMTEIEESLWRTVKGDGAMGP